MALSDGPKASSVWQQLQWIMRPFSFMRACQRQLLLPPFHGERMRSYGELMREITEQVMTEYPPGQPFAARQRMQNISLRVILRAVFGLNEGTRCQRIEQLLSAMLDSLSNPLNAGFLFFPSTARETP